MPKVFEVLEKVKPAYELADKIIMILCKLLLIADIAITCLNVAGRYCQQWAKALPENYAWLAGILINVKDPAWGEEVVLTCMSFMAVLAAALAIRHNAHIRMTALDPYLPKKLIKVLDVVADLAVMTLGIIMLFEGWKYASTIGARGTYVSMPWLSRFWMYFPIPLAGLAMIIFELETLFNHIKAFYEEDEKKEADA